MKINDFFKNNKIAVIAGSAVLAVAIISGTVFGVVNHKNKADSGTFSPKGSLSSSDSDKDSSATGDSSKENTSGEAATGSEATGSEATNSDNSSAENSSNSTIEVIPTPSKNNSSAASSTSSKKPATSTNTPSSSVASTQPAASTPSTPATPTAPSTPSTDKWTCPDPSAHPETDASQCVNEYMHKQHVNVHQRKLQEEAKPNKRNPEDIGTKCYICGRVYGDGHNGTCHTHFDSEKGGYVCEYDY